MNRSLIILFTLFNSFANGQNGVDTSYKTDVRFVTIWDSIRVAYKQSPELVIPLAARLQNSANPETDSIQIIHAIKYQGLAHRKIGNYVRSIEKFKSVYDYAKAKKDSILLAEASDQIGTMYTFMGNMNEAQPYVLETVEIYSHVGSKQDIASANNGLAIFYNDIGQTEKAIETYNIALSQYESLNDTMGRANIHANLGMLYLDEGDYEQAEQNIMMQGKLDTMMNTQWGLGFYHDFMGSLRRKQGRLVEALEWKKSSLKIRENLDSHYNIAESRSGLASVYLSLGNYHESIKNANHILDHKEEHQSLSQQMSSYKLLSSAYEKLGNHKTSLLYHKKYMKMSDSIYNRDLLSEIETKDALYEKAKQDREITKLNAINEIADTKLSNKNKIISIGTVSLAIILTLLLFLCRLLQKYKNKKDKLAKALSEKDILLREIHHRVKNNLQLISSLLTLQGRSIDDEIAIKAINEGKNRVRSMALIHQDLYNKENLTGITVKTYMEKLIQELFDTYRIDKDRIKLELDIEDLELDVDTVIPLGLIINELITNSLKYAFPNEDTGILKVNLSEINDQLVLTISDNGIGYDTTKINKNSFGSTLVNALTEQLEGTIEIDNNQGTTILISIKDYKST